MSKHSEPKGWLIPYYPICQAYEQRKINGTEAVLIAKLDQLCKQEGSRRCQIQNSQIAGWMHKTDNYVSRLLGQLEKKGLLEIIPATNEHERILCLPF